ncbi:CinA family nicotinamide mononucleotide deamidase-related protein [Candidatus Binatia bacterium]|nr:CinA family nicotinamide mononucleotide deamidase-related protein [Candidatus Binatia bacterium]
MLEKVVILSTGDELTTGKIADTNAQWLADRCLTLGLDVVAVLVVGDFHDRIAWAWERAFELGDLVISTGGLGPTSDDLTTEIVAKVLGVGLRFDEPSAARMRALFERMGRVMPENNLRQAQFPDSSVILENPLGTAPGYRVSCEREVPAPGGAGRVRVPRHLVVMPGVPREMKPMFDDRVVPWIRELRGTSDVIAVRTFQTFGMSESALDEAVNAVIRADEARVGFRASFPMISVKLLVRDLPERADARLEELSARLRAALGPVIFGEGDVTMEGATGAALRARGATLAVAESCSGGLIGHRVTEVPGCSAYFLADYVTYSNGAKKDVLGVRAETLEKFGAVSEETVREMAEGARKRSGASVAVATSGVAGPDGGSEKTPVGTVCFALSAEGVLLSRRHQLWGTRDWVKLLTSQLALDWVRRWALGLPVVESGFRR